MAIGPTGAAPLPPILQGQGGSLAPSPLARGLQEAFGFRSRDAQPRTGEPATAGLEAKLRSMHRR